MSKLIGMKTETSKENRLLTVSLMLMLALSVGLYLWETDTGVADPTMFQLPAGVVVDEVMLSDEHDSVRLRVSSTGRWTIGDTLAVQPERMRLMVGALDRARPGRVPAQSRRDSMVNAAIKHGVRARFMEQGKQVLTWYAIGAEGETWFVKPDGSEIRRMSIPGYRSDLLQLLSPRPDDWRELRVFDFNWRNFSRFTMDYPRMPSDGFNVASRDGIFAVQQVAVTDTATLNSYLDAVSLLEADAIQSLDGSQLVQLRSSEPLATLTIQEVSGAVHRLLLYTSETALLEYRTGRFLMVRLTEARRRVLLARRQDFEKQ